MNRIVLALICIVLAGCATLNTADQATLRQRGISERVFQRMKNNESLGLPDIVELSTKGLKPEFIIRYLQNTRQVYPLDSADVAELKRSGVTTEVIDYLLSTPGRFNVQYNRDLYPYDPSWIYSSQRPYYYAPTIIVRDRRERH